MKNAYALCLFAGLREGECLGLSWKQIDFKKKRIIVSQQLQQEKKGAQYYIADSTKSGKPRTIEPPAIAFEYFQDEKRRQLENQLKAGTLWNNPHDLVFTDELGRNHQFSTVYRKFKKIAASIGRPDSPGRGLFYCDIWDQNFLFGVNVGVKPKTPLPIHNFFGQ